MKVIAFDPGKTTGYCVMKFSSVDDPVILDFGELSKVELDKVKLEHLVAGAEFVVVERAVLTGRVNEDKVDQIRVTERIGFVCGERIQWVSPEEKKLITDIPKEIKGNHARDAYKLLKVWTMR